MSSAFLAPSEIAVYAVETSVKKAELAWWRQTILAFMAGAFIAFASEASNMIAFNLLAFPESYGLGRCLAGAIFPTGLILVVVAGAELFTGNTMIGVAVVEKRISVGSVLSNWFFVYLGNMIGSVLVAYMVVNSGLLGSGNNLLGGVTVRIAAYKCSLPFVSAFYLGILCNWLVCLAVWMAWGAKDIGSKVLAIFFPIWLFVASGFEHSVANMYYIPAGIFAKAFPAYAAASGVSAEALANLDWQAFFLKNLLPVSLGNIVGGLLFVVLAYWFVYRPSSKESQIV